MAQATMVEMTELDSNVRNWEAVVSRDASFDGRFVFAVISTNVFCRPSCPSRRPRRDRVRFFRTTKLAEENGFRACLRCKPTQSVDPNAELIRKVCEYLQAEDSESTRLSDLGKMFGVSQFHLQRTFKARVGLTPRQFAAAKRVECFKQLVREGESVTGAMYDAGFTSSSRLYESADDELGMTPASYSKGGRGVEIRYTIVDSILGRLLVAVTARGICSVKMGDVDSELEELLKEEFPLAIIHNAGAELRDTVNAVLATLHETDSVATLPLDVRGTAFQRRVWKELQRIPYGETRSYLDIARSIGNPGAVRAVGGACGSNPLALVIPCHRVVRGDKGLGGYHWGLGRKRRLLELEASTSKKK